MSSAAYERIRQNPKFNELVAARSRFSWMLFAIILVLYYGFIAVVAFQPAWLAQPLGAGRIATVGWPVAAALIVAFWALTGIYMSRANGRFDALNAELLAEAEEAK